MRRRRRPGEVVEEAVQVRRGARRVGGRRPLLELLRAQPALREVVAQRPDGLLPLGGTDADRMRLRCTHATDGTAAPDRPTGVSARVASSGEGPISSRRAGAAVEASGSVFRIEGFDSRHVLELRLLDG